MRDSEREHNTNFDDEVQSFVDEEESKKKNPPFILIFLFTTVSVLFALGLSFSTIHFLENNETINSIISSTNDDSENQKYIITYSENTGAYKSGINLKNQFPISDSEGKIFNGENSVYYFSLILGEKTKGAYYELTAVPDALNTLDSDFVKLYLEKNGKGVDFSYNSKGKVKNFSEYSNSSYEEADGVVIYSGKVSDSDIKNGKIDFALRMWISDEKNISNYQDFSLKTFAIKVNTYAASMGE